jgi:hypothetical protein
MAGLSEASFAKGGGNRPTKLDAQGIWVATFLNCNLPPRQALARQVQQPPVFLIEALADGVDQFPVLDGLVGM